MKLDGGVWEAGFTLKDVFASDKDLLQHVYRCEVEMTPQRE